MGYLSGYRGSFVPITTAREGLRISPTQHSDHLTAVAAGLTGQRNILTVTPDVEADETDYTEIAAQVTAAGELGVGQEVFVEETAEAEPAVY